MKIPQIDLPVNIADDDNPDATKDIEEPFETGRRRLSYREDVWQHYLRVGLLSFAALVASLAVSIFLLHLFSPTAWRWLNDSDLTRIKELALTIIVGIIVSSGILSIFKRK